MKLRDKLIIVFTALVLFVSISISFVSVKLASGAIAEKNRRYFNDITNQATSNISRNVSDMDQITFDILANSSIQSVLRTVNALPPGGLDKTLISNEIDKILFKYTLNNDNIISLSIFSDSGIEFTVNQSVQDETYQLFDKNTIYAANGTTLWGLNKDKSKNFCAAREILDLVTQKPIGYINMVVKESYFGDIVENISSSLVSGTYLVDKDGIVVSTNNSSELGSQLPLYRQIAANDFDSALYTLNGVQNYVFNGKQMDNGWTLITLIPQNELEDETNALIRLILFVDAAVALIAFGILFLFVRRFTDPITKLCRSMENVGQGDFQKKFAVRSNDEIGMLGRSFNSMVENIDNLIKTVYKLEISKKQAELDSLKMQINPHFLYNTLETINWMARMQNNMDIATVTTALGQFFRASVHQSNFITIAEEIKNVQNYLTIQAYRFGNKIKTEISADEDCKDEFIPSFLLQPLVENAIIHGLEPKLTKGILKISIYREEDGIHFMVWDDGVGISEETLQRIRADFMTLNTKNFIGLGNVNKRICLHYGNNCRLTISSGINEGTAVSFIIPRSKI
ncbi:MAG: sensor histidine kinase [Clostridiales bacterium]|nr:sensor histidine kinase [Clostridiales bacterium]